MEPKHSKGEFKIKNLGGDEEIVHIVNGDDGYLSEICTLYIASRNKETLYADANLFAAAPDLLNACNELLALLKYHGYEHSTEIYEAKEAIKKATK